MNIEEVAKNIKRMLLLHPEKRRKILERAEKELPEKILRNIPEIALKLSYDRLVYPIAGLKYSKGPPKEEPGVFTTAVADYFLRNR